MITATDNYLPKNGQYGLRCFGRLLDSCLLGGWCRSVTVELRLRLREFGFSRQAAHLPHSRVLADLGQTLDSDIAASAQQPLERDGSTALLTVAVAMEVPNLEAVFADTGHEHPLTYEYVDYLSDWLQQQGHPPIRRIKADFTHSMQRRRAYLLRVASGEIEDQFGKRRHTRETAARAAEAMQTTGNPFLDLSILKGRFPSTRRRFCSEELKRNPIIEQVFMPMMDGDNMVLSWQGVRADESAARRWLPECDEVGGGLFNFRPILRWTVEDVFDAHRHMGLKPNPLYTMGMGRVGCMPCIHCRKDELWNIAQRFPEVIDHVEDMERQVRLASKRGMSTFFAIADNKGSGIREVVEWAKTSHGGKQYDLFRVLPDGPACTSIYGLCE